MVNDKLDSKSLIVWLYLIVDSASPDSAEISENYSSY
jgi:hypothetical protein